MSELARTNLAKLWANLDFTTVATVKTDRSQLLYLDVQEPTGKSFPDGKPMTQRVPTNGKDFMRMRQVPKHLRPYTTEVWRDFTITTTPGDTFTAAQYNSLDFHANRTFWYGTYANHTSCGRTPETGALIVVDRASKHWFTCGEEFRLLVTLVRDGVGSYAENELGHLLLTKGFPDELFALARLVFFDNVQAFVDGIKAGSPAPSISKMFGGEPKTISTAGPEVGLHPAFGKTYHGGWPVDWRGMWITGGYAQNVHEPSHVLGEPAWWDTFLKLCAEQGVIHSHPGKGGVCGACMAADPDWYTNKFPYQVGDWSS